MSAHCSRQVVEETFYILMVEYFGATRGRQSIVDPEQTRRSIVSEVRDILASTDREVAFVYRFHDGSYEDVTQDVILEAQLSAISDAMAEDPMAARFDHARKLKAEFIA